MSLLRFHFLLYFNMVLLSLGILGDNILPVKKVACVNCQAPYENMQRNDELKPIPNSSSYLLADTCEKDMIGWKNMQFIFMENGCQSCHGNNGSGGFDLSSYVSFIQGGNKCRTDILTGNTFVNIITIDGYNGCGTSIASPAMNQRTGNNLDAGELAAIQTWIDFGAPEDCICLPNAPDSDGDGVCDMLDECPNFDNNLIGTACDDNLACTINDIWTSDCNCEGTPLQTSCEEMDISAFLEGPLRMDTMGSFLRSQIELLDPYLGLDSVATIPPNVVDWVLIQIRDSADSKTILTQRAAFLNTQGKVISTDSHPKIGFRDSIPSHAFVAIIHRNHLGIMTLNPVALTQALDFSDPNTEVFGLNPRKIINNKAVLIAGDANADGTINAVDKNSYWRVQNGNPFDYNNAGGDMNMDGSINAVDINGYWRINNSMISQIPK